MFWSWTFWHCSILSDGIGVFIEVMFVNKCADSIFLPFWQGLSILRQVVFYITFGFRVILLTLLLRSDLSALEDLQRRRGELEPLLDKRESKTFPYEDRVIQIKEYIMV